MRATRREESDPTASVPNALPKERKGNALPGVVSLLSQLGNGLSLIAQNGHRNVVKANKNNKLKEQSHSHTRVKPSNTRLRKQKRQIKAKQETNR